MHSACFAGDVDTVSMLLDFGALEDARDSNVRDVTLHSYWCAQITLAVQLAGTCPFARGSL